MKIISVKNTDGHKKNNGFKLYIDARQNTKKFLEDTHFEVEFYSDKSHKFSFWRPFMSLKNKLKNWQGVAFSFNTNWNGRKYRINIKMER